MGDKEVLLSQHRDPQQHPQQTFLAHNSSFIGGEYETDYDLATVRDAFQSIHLRVSRTFALFSLFDGLFCVTLWAVISQGFHGEWKNSGIYDSIVYFKFDTSMFDVICVAVARMIIYIVVYWGMKSGRSIFVVITTTVSVLFILVKLFFFKFSLSDLAYLVFIVAFILPWIEAYMFMNKISPVTKKLALLYGEGTSHQVYPSDVRQILIERDHGMLVPQGRRFPRSHYGSFPEVASTAQSQTRRAFNAPQANVPEDTDNDYDDDENLESASHYNRQQIEKQNSGHLQTDPLAYANCDNVSVHSNSHHGQEVYRLSSANATMQHMMSLARAAADHVEECATRDTDSNNESLWNTVQEHQGVVVQWRKVDNRKVYRCQGLVWASPESLFQFLLDDFDQAHNWSSFWDAVRIQRKIDSHTDVLHIALKKMGILSSKRDLTVVRYWRHFSTTSTLAFRSVRDPLLPARRNVTRAHDGGSGFFLQHVNHQKQLTKLTFVFDMDLKTSFINSDSRVQSILKCFHDEVRLALEQRADKSQTVGKHHFV
eukprot:m.29638 g.29638  ORF g.29638 m.29638 type:complete len:541 (+) comp6173_c1_seq1:126-1748(+)